MSGEAAQARRELHRSISDPLISVAPKVTKPIGTVTIDGLLRELTSRRSIFLAVFLIFSLFMVTCSALYSSAFMPLNRALPDIIADLWPPLGFMCSSTFLSKIPFASLVTLFLVGGAGYYTYRCWSICNIRKYVFIFSVTMLIRSICIVSTQLPPPCNGFPNCKCVENSYSEVRKSHSIVRIALTYIATFGLGTSSIPACGDLLMSGHTALHCCLGAYFIDILEKIVTTEKLRAAQFIVWGLIGLSVVYTVITRKEYTIGPAVSIFFVYVHCLVFRIYDVMCRTSYGPFLTRRVGQFYTWLQADYEDLEMSEENVDV